MTNKQVVENIPESKLKIVSDLANLIETKRTVLVADISNIPGSQFQLISKKLRGKASVKVPKKNLFFRALDEVGKEEIIKIKDQLDGSVALLFSDLDSYELAAELVNNKSPAKAKTGQIAPADIEVPAGPTDLTPGPAISELGALGIQIMIKNGKIDIKEAKIVAQEGEPISSGAADILSKLDIKPFTIGFTPLCAYDAEDNILYLEIKIDSEEAKADLLYSYNKALPFAISIGYISEDTIRPMISKAASHEKKIIRTINGEPDEEVVVAPVEEVEKETPKEEKEESKPAAGEGLASLFG